PGQGRGGVDVLPRPAVQGTRGQLRVLADLRRLQPGGGRRAQGHLHGQRQRAVDARGRAAEDGRRLGQAMRPGTGHPSCRPPLAPAGPRWPPLAAAGVPLDAPTCPTGEERYRAMTDTLAEIEAFATEASTVVPHRFTLITALDDGTAIPPEALSEDHSVGLY